MKGVNQTVGKELFKGFLACATFTFYALLIKVVFTLVEEFGVFHNF